MASFGSKETYIEFLNNLTPLVLGVDSTTGNSVSLTSKTFKDTLAWMQLAMRLEKISNLDQKEQAARLFYETIRERTALYRSNGRAFDQVFAISGTHGVYPFGFLAGAKRIVVTQAVSAGSTVQDAVKEVSLKGGLGEHASAEKQENEEIAVNLNLVPYRTKDNEALPFEDFRKLHLDALISGLEESLEVMSEEDPNPPVYSHAIAIPPKGGLIYKQIEELILDFDLKNLLNSSQITVAQKEIVQEFLDKQGQVLLVLDAAQERWLVNPDRILQLCEEHQIPTVWMSTVSKSTGALKLAGVFYYTDLAKQILKTKIEYANPDELKILHRFFALGYFPADLEALINQKLKEAQIADHLEIDFITGTKILGVAERYQEFHQMPEGRIQVGINWLRNLANQELAQNPQLTLMDEGHPDLEPSMVMTLLLKGKEGKAFSSEEIKRTRAMLRMGAQWVNNKLDLTGSKVFSGNPYSDITAEVDYDANQNTKIVKVDSKKHDAFIRFGPRMELLMLITDLLERQQELSAKAESADSQVVSEELKEVDFKLLVITELWRENFRRLAHVVEHFKEIEKVLYKGNEESNK